MLHRILVVYGTTDGHTRKVAETLAEMLRSDGAHVDVVHAARREGFDPQPERYDGVIVAASVHAGGYQRGVRRWVALHAPALRERPTAFVSVCLGVLEHNPNTDREIDAIMAKFLALTGWTPSVRKLVAGALPYTKYNWVKRYLMRRIVAKAGGDVDTSRDYEYTDWNDLRAFAREFLRPRERATRAG